MALGTLTRASVCGSGRAWESGRGVWSPWWGREVGPCPCGNLCPGNHVNWPWPAAGRKRAQIGHCFWQGSLPGIMSFPCSALCSLFMDGVGESHKSRVISGSWAGCWIPNHPCEFGSPAGTAKVWKPHPARASLSSLHGRCLILGSWDLLTLLFTSGFQEAL